MSSVEDYDRAAQRIEEVKDLTLNILNDGLTATELNTHENISERVGSIVKRLRVPHLIDGTVGLTYESMASDPLPIVPIEQGKSVKTDLSLFGLTKEQARKLTVLYSIWSSNEDYNPQDDILDLHSALIYVGHTDKDYEKIQLKDYGRLRNALILNHFQRGKMNKAVYPSAPSFDTMFFFGRPITAVSTELLGNTAIASAVMFHQAINLSQLEKRPVLQESESDSRWISIDLEACHYSTRYRKLFSKLTGASFDGDESSEYDESTAKIREEYATRANPFYATSAMKFALMQTALKR